jgi:predicted CoA-binding protein
MIPVNPKEADSRIRGLPVYSSLSAIDRPVDMVEIFRTSEAALCRHRGGHKDRRQGGLDADRRSQ